MEADDPLMKPLEDLFAKKKSLLPTRLSDRIEGFLTVLRYDKIPLSVLKTRSFSGIPDDLNGLRALAWKLILNYIPSQRSEWKSSLEMSRDNYNLFIQELLVRKPKEQNKNSGGAGGKVDLIEAEDHPLNRAQNSEWKEYFDDHELWETIDKDTKRTRAEMDFFQKPVTRTQKPIEHKFVSLLRKSQKESWEQKKGAETHTDVIQRILFIYAKLNKGISYVQGMNELLAPIYYCFSNDPNPAFAEHAEGDAFWCFTNLMAEVKDSFVRSLDQSESGIKSRVQKVHNLLRVVDEELWEHFEAQGVNPMFYCMRWVMLFLTQEFELGEVMTLWDSLLSHDNKMEFVDFICVAIIREKRDILINGEFADILEALRRIDTIDLHETLNEANELSNKYHGQRIPVDTSPKKW